MTRDETVRERTVERFLECEAKRTQARVAALAEGKSEFEAREIAREAAREHWNIWAKGRLAKRKDLEVAGTWAARKGDFRILISTNADTRAWIDDSKASFSRCVFLFKGNEETREALGNSKEEPEAGSLPIKLIKIGNSVADFSDFIFPGDARFESATFEGGVQFDSAIFKGFTEFGSATIGGHASFEGATFGNQALFNSTTFKSGAWFTSAIFEDTARFDTAFDGKSTLPRQSSGG